MAGALKECPWIRQVSYVATATHTVTRCTSARPLPLPRTPLLPRARRLFGNKLTNKGASALAAVLKDTFALEGLTCVSCGRGSR